MQQTDQEWLQEKLKDSLFQKEYELLRFKYSEVAAIRKLKRKQWMREAMQQYADSDTEKFWEPIDGEDFKENHE